MKFSKNQKGLTMVELLLVMGIMSTLFGITILSLFNLNVSTVKEVTTNVLISDIKSQQIKSMVGDTEGRGTPDNYGVIIEGDRYTLFHGQAFDPDDQANFSIPAEEGFSISSTFQDNTIRFASGSGEILDFVDGQNTITTTNIQTGESKTVELNKLGVITDDS